MAISTRNGPGVVSCVVAGSGEAVWLGLRSIISKPAPWGGIARGRGGLDARGEAGRFAGRRAGGLPVGRFLSPGFLRFNGRSLSVRVGSRRAAGGYWHRPGLSPPRSV